MERVGRLLTISFIVMLFAGCGSGGESSGNSDAGADSSLTWLIPEGEVYDGGPGKDGIPSIDAPRFVTADSEEAMSLPNNAFVVGIAIGETAKAYPHAILNWHEIVNDFTSEVPVTLSYCPLTGSAIAWKRPATGEAAQFGVSGLLYNSNLILYDRASDSNWSQMQQKSVYGSRAGESLEQDQVRIVETTWSQWREWYPDSMLLSFATGYSRNYASYPYGDYLFTTSLLFPANNSDDTRMHPKSRALGVIIDNAAKVYPISSFSDDFQVINDVVQDRAVLVIGSSGSGFGLALDRRFNGEDLVFSEVFDATDFHIQDQYGRIWTIMGEGVSEDVQGEMLGSVNHFIAFWFAWAAFYPGLDIYRF